MSGGMESPLMEALVFNCGAGINLGLVLNNLWTWVAVLTAAVSFWRIRSFKPDSTPEPVPVHSSYEDKQKPQHADPVQLQETETEPEQTASTSSRLDDVAFSRVTKGNKYKAYYGSSDEEEREKEKESEGEWVVVEEWTASPMVSVSVAEMGKGWYSYQDTSVLDGSVVRLWDHCCLRRTPSLVGVTRIIQDCN